MRSQASVVGDAGSPAAVGDPESAPRPVDLSEFSIVCLAQSRWDADLPTNRQQIMRRAAEFGHEVLFVDTAPFLGRRLAAVLRRRSPFSALLDVVRPATTVTRVRVMTGFNVLPWGSRFRFPNAVNTWLTGFFVRRAARALPHPVALWIYDPCAAPLIGACSESVTAYDCVDDYSAIGFYAPRERALARRYDRQAAASSDVVFTTTSPLYERHRRLNAHTHLVGNVGDYAHFERAADRENAPDRLRSLPRPILGFAGNIISDKIDMDLVARIAETAVEAGTLLLAGPAEPAMEARIDSLQRRSRVVWLGQVPYAELPSVVSAFDVGLIPYRENDYTRSCFPLKLFEYLAAGKPVVASGLPALRGMEPDVVVADGAAEFEVAIRQALLLVSNEDVERRRRIARSNTWETRAETLLRLVRERLDETQNREELRLTSPQQSQP